MYSVNSSGCAGSGCDDEFSDSFGKQQYEVNHNAPFESVDDSVLAIRSVQKSPSDQNRPSSMGLSLRTNSIDSLGSEVSAGQQSIASQRSRFDFAEEEGEDQELSLDSEETHQAISKELERLRRAETEETIVKAASSLGNTLLGKKLEDKVRKFKKELETSLRTKSAILEASAEVDVNSKFLTVFKLAKSLDSLRETVTSQFRSLTKHEVFDDTVNAIFEQLPWSSSPWLVSASHACRKAGIKDILLEKISATGTHCLERLRKMELHTDDENFSYVKNHYCLTNAMILTPLTPALQLIYRIRMIWKSMSGLDCGISDVDKDDDTPLFDFTLVPLRTRRELATSLIIGLKLVEKWNRYICEFVKAFSDENPMELITQSKSEPRGIVDVTVKLSWLQQRVSIINSVSILYSNLYRYIQECESLLAICKQVADDAAVESMIHESGNIVSQVDVINLEEGLQHVDRISERVMHGLTFHLSRCFIEQLLTQVVTDLGFYDWMASMPIQTGSGPLPAVQMLNVRIAGLIFDFDIVGALSSKKGSTICSTLDRIVPLDDMVVETLDTCSLPSATCQMARHSSWPFYCFTHILREVVSYLRSFYNNISIQFSQQPQLRSDLSHVLVMSLAALDRAAYPGDFEENRSLLRMYMQCVHQILCLLWEFLIACCPLCVLVEFLEALSNGSNINFGVCSDLPPDAWTSPLKAFALCAQIEGSKFVYTKSSESGCYFDVIAAFRYTGLVGSGSNKVTTQGLLTECQNYLGGHWTGRAEDVDARDKDEFPWNKILDGVVHSSSPYCPFTRQELQAKLLRRSELLDNIYPPLPEKELEHVHRLSSVIEALG